MHSTISPPFHLITLCTCIKRGGVTGCPYFTLSIIYIDDIQGGGREGGREGGRAKEKGERVRVCVCVCASKYAGSTVS